MTKTWLFRQNGLQFYRKKDKSNQKDHKIKIREVEKYQRYRDQIWLESS